MQQNSPLILAFAILRNKSPLEKLQIPWTIVLGIKIETSSILESLLLLFIMYENQNNFFSPSPDQILPLLNFPYCLVNNEFNINLL